LTDDIVSVNYEETPLHDFVLKQNYPNPFNPSTKIKFRISSASGGEFVKLKVYDVLGNEIATLVNESKTVGTYEILWNAENLPSGVYLYKLTAGNLVETKKMLLLK
jgi:DNA recombination-dependent growth factor C